MFFYPSFLGSPGKKGHYWSTAPLQPDITRDSAFHIFGDASKAQWEGNLTGTTGGIPSPAQFQAPGLQSSSFLLQHPTLPQHLYNPGV